MHVQSSPHKFKLVLLPLLGANSSFIINHMDRHIGYQSQVLSICHNSFKIIQRLFKLGNFIHNSDGSRSLLDSKRNWNTLHKYLHTIRVVYNYLSL